MSYKFKIEERAPQPTVTIRTQTSMDSLPASFEQALEKVYGHISQSGQHPTGPAFALYHTQDPSNFDLEAGFPVQEPIAANGDVQSSQIPGGRACTTVLHGSYDELPNAWEAITAHVDEQGLESESYGLEFYLNDPTTVSPEEIQTLIVLPIKD